MRAQRRGRIINVSSILGFIPQPFMAVYAASKHASPRWTTRSASTAYAALLVEPAVTKTGVEAARSSMQPDAPLQLYAEQRHQADDAMTAAVKNGDDPATVARAMVAAAADALQ